jgi:hypothetical protein
METDPEHIVRIVSHGNPLIAVPVGIIFKSPIFYGGKLRANRIETDMQISKMDERGITLDDGGTWVPYSNISSISPMKKPTEA